MKDSQLMLSLFAQLERDNVVSIPQSAVLYGCTQERVYDALACLVHCYDSVDVRLELHESYAELRRAGTSRTLRLTREEGDVLLSALDGQAGPTVEALRGKLVAAMNDRAGDAPLLARVSATHDDSTMLAVLSAACEDPLHHHLRIAYCKEGQREAEERIVEPLCISAEGGHRYLYAYCPAASGWRSFRTDRVQAAEPLSTRFTPRGDETDDEGPASQMARVAFAPGAVLPEWPGLVEQRRRGAGGERIVRVPWRGTEWLAHHIVAHAARPLEPPELVEMTRTYAEQLLAGLEGEE